MATEMDVTAWECRDKEEQARVNYHNPLRRTNRSLTDENLRLKRILRENGIPWSSVAQTHLSQVGQNKRRTRSSMTSMDMGRPHLPMEVILRILKFALTSSRPVIDPLSSRTTANLTEEEKSSRNQIAIHFLATCKALHEEGTKILWGSNSFVFTTPQAVRAFADLNAEHRNKITQVTFRIVAKYYDDNMTRKQKLERFYHPSLKKDVRLRVLPRPREVPLIRGGLRSYAWTQIVDFLTALRAPYDPQFHLKKTPRPKLLPGLGTLRLDLINFSDSLLQFSGPEFHDVTSHEFGCTLNELQVTGLPIDDVGMKAGAELSGLLKDEGLYLDGVAAFVLPYRGPLQPLKGEIWRSRVVRARDGLDDDSDDSDLEMSPDVIFRRGHTKIGVMPPAPEEHGHPPSTRPDDMVIWKRVPDTRDSTDRSWVQFSRYTGREISEYDSDDEICPCCGEPHPGSSFLGMLADEFDEYDDYFDDDE